MLKVYHFSCLWVVRPLEGNGLVLEKRTVVVGNEQVCVLVLHRLLYVLLVQVSRQHLFQRTLEDGIH